MDIKRKQINKQNNRHIPWVIIFILIGIVIMAWGIWFYPKNISSLNSQKSTQGFESFKSELKDVFSIFKKEEVTYTEVQKLRQRVFGDAIERVK